MKNLNQALQFFKEVRAEMGKVKWPTIPDWIGATIIVLIIMIVFAIYLGAIDYAFYNLLFKKILSL